MGASQFCKNLRSADPKACAISTRQARCLSYELTCNGMLPERSHRVTSIHAIASLARLTLNLSQTAITDEAQRLTNVISPRRRTWFV
jgi:hypothetical protein